MIIYKILKTLCPSLVSGLVLLNTDHMVLRLDITGCFVNPACVSRLGGIGRNLSD